MGPPVLGADWREEMKFNKRFSIVSSAQSEWRRDKGWLERKSIGRECSRTRLSEEIAARGNHTEEIAASPHGNFSKNGWFNKLRGATKLFEGLKV